MSNLGSIEKQNFRQILPEIEQYLKAFFDAQREIYLGDLVSAVRMKNRDIQAEAQIAGRIDAYETAMNELVNFFKE